MKIPGYGDLDIEDIVCDFNGTVAKEGILLADAAEVIEELTGKYRVHIITADTFGSVAAQVDRLGVELKILETGDHTTEKREYIETLGSTKCAAIGNGNNDLQMLQAAALGIAVIADEGCSVKTLMSADIVCRSGYEALALFAAPKRLIATLRK
ncbi:HAD family hydrolase, a [Hydrogenimonas sp.]|nr:HAD family hydrolase, a [Hydrogenimonas sp.]